MAELQPVSPPTGRSRFSKALPVPPESMPRKEIGERSNVNSFPSTGPRGKSNPFPSFRPPAAPLKEVLPVTPLPSLKKSSSPNLTPLQTDIAKTPDKMPLSIPRRPVGGVTATMSDTKRESHMSEASVSSIYSDYGRPRSSTGSSSYVTKDSSVDSMDDDFLPPPPPKDYEDVGQTLEFPQTPGRLHSSSISSDKSSPGRSEIWRRRSLKGERGVNISDLKLTQSNGFTESPTAINNTSSITREVTPPPAPQHLPRSKGSQGGLPGRNIRKPVPARAAPPQPIQVDTMGSSHSKVIDKLRRKEAPVIGINQESNASAIQDSLQARDSPGDPQSSESPPLAKQHIVSRVSPQRHPGNVVSQSSFTPTHSVSNSQLTITQDIHSSANNLRSSDPYSHQAINEFTNVVQPSVQAEQYFPSSISPSTSNSPEEIISPGLAPAARFHKAIGTWAQGLAPRGTIFDSLGVNVVHIRCFTHHQKMISVRNDVYPVACQVCDTRDTSRRWRCTFCALSSCESCMMALRSDKNRDLTMLLTNIGRPDKVTALMPTLKGPSGY